MEESRRPKLRRALRYTLLYGGVFLVTFAATIYWTFPYALVTEKLVGEIERSAGVSLAMEDISPHWGLGLRARDVMIYKDGADAGGTGLKLDSVTVRLRLLSTVLTGPSVSFDLDGDLGRLRGTAQKARNDDVGIDLDIRTLSLGKVPGLAEALGVGLLGDVSGSVAVSFPQGRTEELSGVLDLRIAESGLGGGMIRGATVPPIEFGEIEPRIVAEVGTLRLDPTLVVSSDDLDAEVSGTLQLRGNIATSRADITLRFRPTDRFWEANQMLAGLARAMLSQAQQSDGFYAYSLSGAIGRPDFRPVR